MTALTTEQKRIEPLVGKELIRKVKELGKLSRTEKAKACGYYGVTKNGLVRVNMKQFLNALVEAEGIELGENTLARKNGATSASSSIAVQSNNSANSNQIIKVNRISKTVEKPKQVSQLTGEQDPPIEPASLVEVELLEQPEPVVQLESLAEFPREESVYGSGWSLAELMNEFGGRVGGWGYGDRSLNA